METYEQACYVQGYHIYCCGRTSHRPLLRSAHDLYERKNITVNVGHAFVRLLLGTLAGWAWFFHSSLLLVTWMVLINFVSTATALILPLQL